MNANAVTRLDPDTAVRYLRTGKPSAGSIMTRINGHYEYH